MDRRFMQGEVYCKKFLIRIGAELLYRSGSSTMGKYFRIG